MDRVVVNPLGWVEISSSNMPEENQMDQPSQSENNFKNLGGHRIVERRCLQQCIIIAMSFLIAE